MLLSKTTCYLWSFLLIQHRLRPFRTRLVMTTTRPMTPSATLPSFPSSPNIIHAHPAIVKYLHCDSNVDQPPDATPRISLDTEGNLVFGEVLHAPVSCEDLVSLALECDRYLYDPEPSSSSSTTTTTTTRDAATRTLVRMCEDDASPAVHAAAALLALNRLESAIRRHTGYATGRAPLLKTMTVELGRRDDDDDDDMTNLSWVLQGLLSPTGLNLRNLLWHGFCGGLPRPWSSLAVCLTEILERNGDCGSPHESSSSSTFTVRDLSDIPARYTGPGMEKDAIGEWLPASHRALWRLARRWLSEDYPACGIAILSVLLEHGLRLEWCEANGRPEDRLARPHRFYVTLDGHGQRHLHDVLLHPYRCDGSPNALLTCDNNHNNGGLDGSCTALLTDLFCSASGPNMRAALAHGLWDEYLEQELIRMGGGSATKDGADTRRSSSPDGPPRFLRDHASAVLVALRAVAGTGRDDDHRPSCLTYRPRFSYTATTRQSLVDCQMALRALVVLVHEQGDNECDESSLPSFLAKLRIPRSRLESSLSEMIDTLTCTEGIHNDDDDNGNNQQRAVWTIEQVYQEHGLNQLLAPLGATQQLARDVADAVTKLHAELQEARAALVEEEEDDDEGAVRLSTRQRRRYARVLTLGTPGAIFYGFTTWIALLSLQDAVLLEGLSRWDAKDHLKMVERSRMVVSTVSMFLTNNTERAYKSMGEYCKGKIIKQVFPLLDQMSK